MWRRLRQCFNRAINKTITINESDMQPDPAKLFEDIYQRYYEQVHQQVLRMTGSAFHADDIAQDIFLKLWVRRDELAGIHHIASWLTLVTRRQGLNYLARKKMEARHQDKLPATGNAASIDDYVLEQQCSRLLRSANARLSRRQQEVLHLRWVRGMGRQQIAHELSITEHTTRDHLRASSSFVRRYISWALELAPPRRA